MDELSERLARLEPLKSRSKAEFDADPYLRDIAERNLEVAAQCVLDISHRLISLAGGPRPRDYYEAILRLGELGVLPPDFARTWRPWPDSATSWYTNTSKWTGRKCTGTCSKSTIWLNFPNWCGSGCAGKNKKLKTLKILPEQPQKAQANTPVPLRGAGAANFFSISRAGLPPPAS